jgi:hypothetical protein
MSLLPGEKFTIVNIGAGTGIVDKYIVPFLPESIVSTYIYTDPFMDLLILRPSHSMAKSPVVLLKEPDFTVGLQKPKSEQMRREQMKMVESLRQKFDTDIFSYLHTSESLVVPTKIVMHHAKMDVVQAIDNVKRLGTKNV